MTTMIEKVARAICYECNEKEYDELPEAATYLERKTNPYRAIPDRFEAQQVARAAIEAMRGPTPEMTIVLRGADMDHAEAWYAMIDAALSETDA